MVEKWELAITACYTRAYYCYNSNQSSDADVTQTIYWNNILEFLVFILFGRQKKKRKTIVDAHIRFFSFVHSFIQAFKHFFYYFIKSVYFSAMIYIKIFVFFQFYYKFLIAIIDALFGIVPANICIRFDLIKNRICSECSLRLSP